MEFTVEGTPVPQGSKRLGKNPRTGAPIVLDDNPNLAVWRDLVAWQARAARSGGPLVGAVRAELLFRLPPPQRPTRTVPSVRPDIDKLVRSTLDSLTDAQIWGDDGQVVELHAEKVYGPPGLWVRITTSES